MNPLGFIIMIGIKNWMSSQTPYLTHGRSELNISFQLTVLRADVIFSHFSCLQAELKLFLLLPMGRVLDYNQNQLLLHLVWPQYQHCQWKIAPQKSNVKVMTRNQTTLKYCCSNIAAAFCATISPTTRILTRRLGGEERPMSDFLSFPMSGLILL